MAPGLILTSVFLGLATHRFVKSHEPDALLFISYMGIILWLVALEQVKTNGDTLVHALRRTFLAALTFCSTLGGSIVVRRVFFHPLSSYPGTVLARISRLWNVRIVISSKHYRVVRRMRSTGRLFASAQTS